MTEMRFETGEYTPTSLRCWKKARKAGTAYHLHLFGAISEIYWNKIRISDKKEMANELSFVDK